MCIRPACAAPHRAARTLHLGACPGTDTALRGMPQRPVCTIIPDLACDLRRKAAILAAYCHGDTPDLRTIFVYRQTLRRLNNELSVRSVNQRGQWALCCNR